MKTRGLLLSLILIATVFPTRAAMMTDYGLSVTFSPAKQPQGIALGADGELWVAALAANSIIKISVGGAVLAEYPIPTSNSQPLGLAAGPDGAVWFTEYGAGKIGRITTAGVVNEFPLPSGASQPYFICPGPDGALWYAEYGVSRIGRITTAGVVTEFDASGAPTGICSGPDGAMWFTEYSGGRIGRITTAGVVTEFDVPSVASFPYAIAAGSDGALWFTESGTNRIGRVTTAGIFAEFDVPSANSGLAGIFAGPDGSLWFAESTKGRIGRVSIGGTIVEFPCPGGTQAQPATFSAGPFGTFWFTEAGANRAARINLADPLVEYALPGTYSPQALVSGPDGAIWYVSGDSIIRRITSSGVVTEFPVPSVWYGSGITVGSDGALWFAASTQALGRITTAGAHSEHPLPPNGNSVSSSMILGADGNIWFSRFPTIGRITPAGNVVEWTLSPQSGATALAAGPDGNIWAALTTNNLVARVTTSGGQSTFSLSTGYPQVNGMASGPDGNLWLAIGSAMLRLTPTGIATPVPLTLPGSYYADYFGITAGPDGNLWTTVSGRVVQFATNGSVLGMFAMWPFATNYGPSNSIVAGPGNTIWFVDRGSPAIGRVTIPAPKAAGTSLNTLTPCRLLDTRLPDGPFGGPYLYGGSTRNFVPVGTCGIPLSARALSVNVTTVSSGGFGTGYSGELLLYPSDIQQPSTASTISYLTGRDRANNAIVQLSSDGTAAFSVYNRGYIAIHYVVDVNGWFE